MPLDDNDDDIVQGICDLSQVIPTATTREAQSKMEGTSGSLTYYTES